MGIDVPGLLAELGMAKDATEVVKTVVEYALIKFYYLFRVGEYALKGKSNEKNQTVQFKL